MEKHMMPLFATALMVTGLAAILKHVALLRAFNALLNPQHQGSDAVWSPQIFVLMGKKLVAERHLILLSAIVMAVPGLVSILMPACPHPASSVPQTSQAQETSALCLLLRPAHTVVRAAVERHLMLFNATVVMMVIGAVLLQMPAWPHPVSSVQ